MLRYRRSGGHDHFHLVSLGPHDLDHADIGGVSRECIGHFVPTRSDDDHGAQPSCRAAYDVIEGNALAEATGDPHDRVERMQRRRGRVRAGCLRVIDKSHAVDARDLGDPVRRGCECPQTFGYRSRDRPERTCECRGRQRVRHVVRTWHR